jgi:shikimate kinase
MSASEPGGGQQRHIILIGFMGAGKTTVAQKIASWQRLSCVDMDAWLEREQKLPVPEIFARYGEERFRQLESEFLTRLPTDERIVLACGGGVVEKRANRALLKAAGTVVYLAVTLDVALARIGDTSSRPLLSGAVAPRQLLERRRAAYEQTADFAVDTDGLDADAVARRVVAALEARGEL